jgi:citrate lyase subunit beta/citryl-CoA lyase
MLRSQLFVPGNDERKIRKSVSLMSDVVIFDLEDSVPTQDKSRARGMLERLLNELDWGRKRLSVRINKVGSEYSNEDIELCKRVGKITTIVLPKAEERPTRLPTDSGKSLIPLIETAKGLMAVESIVRSEGVVAISYGAADFANSVGGKMNVYSGNLYVKTKIVIAARAYGIDPIDCVYFDLKDLEGFEKEAAVSRDLGYVGKQVVHPSQIDIANRIYSPTPEEIASARTILEFYETSTKAQVGAFKIDDKLIDAVHYRRAKALLESIETTESGDGRKS